MTWRLLYTINLVAISAVWAASGLLGKLLHLLPRHELIVARILGPTYAAPLTYLIGVGELLLAGWVLSRHYPGWCAGVQITLILTMNVLETILAPDLLLWGRANFLFAVLFCGFIGWNQQLVRFANPRSYV